MWVTAIAGVALLWGPAGAPAQAQSSADFVPVTDAMLQAPAPDDWLMWRRTLDGWGYSPLDQITRENVSGLRMVWTRALTRGSQQGTPLAYDGVLYMPNPRDVIQAIDAATGDLKWEQRREVPEGSGGRLAGLRSATGQDHGRPVAGHGGGYTEAQARAATGDQGHPVLKEERPGHGDIQTPPSATSVAPVRAAEAGSARKLRIGARS